MTNPNRSLPGTTGNGPGTPDVFLYRREVPYIPSTRHAVTQPPETEIRPAGPLGWGRNGQDVAHEQRLRELYYIRREIQYWEQVALEVELEGIDRAREATAEAREIVYTTRPGTIEAGLTEDLVQDMAARTKLRHGRGMDTLDALGLDIVHHRR